VVAPSPGLPILWIVRPTSPGRRAPRAWERWNGGGGLGLRLTSLARLGEVERVRVGRCGIGDDASLKPKTYTSLYTPVQASVYGEKAA